jgi:hypothetical protein
MKKTFKILFVSLLVLGFLSFSFGKTFASGLSVMDPMAVSSNPDLQFSTKTLTPVELPGTTNNSSGMFLPLGFPDGQKQFDGNSLMVSGLKEGETVNLQFDFPLYSYKWSGTIYMWSGSEWMPLDTTVTQGADGSRNWATTNGVGNGVYALLMGYHGPAHHAPVEEVASTPPPEVNIE